MQNNKTHEQESNIRFSNPSKQFINKDDIKPLPFICRTFNDNISDAEKLPPAIKLFGDFIYENEVTLLVGDNGTGKSIFAVKVAQAIANGNTNNTPFDGVNKQKRVLYIDYELTDRQFFKRFPKKVFPENLYRVSLNPECYGCDINKDTILDLIKKYKSELVIIDNITAMLKESTKEADVAIETMRWFKQLQINLKLTLIVIAHTPKIYDNVILKTDHVAGSKNMTNYADSVFFIARSEKGKNIRYLTHVKTRNVEEPDGVFDIKLIETEEGLKFDYIEMSKETTHFKPRENSNLNKYEGIKELRDYGKTLREVGEIYGIDKSTVLRNLKK